MSLPLPPADDELEDIDFPYDPEEEARFYSPENIARIREAIASLARGESRTVIVTMEELEAMAQ